MKDVIKTQQKPDEIKTINGQRVRVNRRKRRSNMKGYYALAMMFVALIVLFLCLTVFFRTSDIKVEGVTLYRYDQIINVGGVSTGANLMRMDTDTIEQRILDNLVYIDEVTVKKQYPSTVVISCKEAKKSADIKDGKKYYVVSDSGKILEAETDKHTKGLPIIIGFEIKSKNQGDKLESNDAFKADILEELLKCLDEQDFDKVTKIDLTSRSDIKLFYDGRIEIDMGSSVDIDYKLSYFKAVIDKSLTKDYEGVLIYNGVDSGISAIPKDKTDSSSKSESSSKTENTNTYNNSSSAVQTENSDSSNAMEAAVTEQNTDTVYNNGYSDTAQTTSYSQWNADNYGYNG